MDTVDLIIKSSTEFYNDLKVDENGRYRSWEHLSLIHISEPTRLSGLSRMPSSA